jgi:hypothetical protein
LIQGYALNQKRFEENAAELKQALALIQKAARSPALATDMGRGLVDIMGRYTTTFLWLQQYDEGLLKEPGGFPGGILPTVESKAAHLSHFVVKNHIPGVPTAVMRPTTPCKKECILSQWKI